MGMKHSVMTWRKEIRLSPVPPPGGGPEGRGGSAFDLWLRRGLHQLFDDVAKEPVPDELLRLIEGDRATGADGGSPPATDVPPGTAPDGAEKQRGGAAAKLHRKRGDGR
jgi:hypothetical protein